MFLPVNKMGVSATPVFIYSYLFYTILILLLLYYNKNIKIKHNLM